MKIDELYFGVMLIDWNEHKLSMRNLFDLTTIKRSVALYASMNELDRKNLPDPLSYCFSDVRARTEYEMYIGDYRCTTPEKTDIYSMFVIPNQDYLMSLVSQISSNEGKKWLKEHKL